MSSELPVQDQTFRIGVLLGQTPLAQTFLAIDAHGQQVALKHFTHAAAALPEFSNRLRERYLRQAQVRQSKHPNLAPLGVYGTINSRPMLSMPFYGRGSLRSLMELPDGSRASLPRHLAIDLIWQAARGVAYAHSAGIIHANLKPSNLLLLPEIQQVETRHGFHVLVSDFTIVPPLIVDQTDHDLIAAESRLYALPPEHYDPDGIGQIDARADVYALGIMLYEALIGSPPFMVASYEDALALHLYDQSALFDSTHIPVDLQPILARCLARLPQDRYQSARELADTLESLLPARRHPLSMASNGQAVPIETNPQIRIFRGEQRYNQRTYPFDGSGLLIGSGTLCGLRLPELPEQLIQIDWNGAQVTATTLSAQLVVRIGNVLVEAGTHMIWDWNQSLACGPYLLRLEQPDVLLPVSDQPAALEVQQAPEAVSPLLGMQQSDHLKIAVEPANLSVAPGIEARAMLKIENRSPIVERLLVTFASNDAERWVSVPKTEVTCPGNGEVNLPLVVNIPRVAASRAGSYQVTLLVTSLVDRQGHEVGEQTIQLTNHVTWELNVQRFAAPVLEMRPKRLSISRSGRCSAFVRNDGNTSEEYQLISTDEPQLIDCVPDKLPFSLNPGQTFSAPIEFQPHQLIWFGQTVRHDLKVTLNSATGGTPALVTAGVILDQQPVFKQWQVIFLLVLFMLPFLCIFLFGITTREVLDKPISRLPGYSLLNPTKTPMPTATATATALPTLTPTLDPEQITMLVIAPPRIETLTPVVLPTFTPAPTFTPVPAPTATTLPNVGAVPPNNQPSLQNPGDPAAPQPTFAPVPDGGVILCLPEIPVPITGSGPAGAPIQLFFNGRRVDQGQDGDPEIAVRIGDDGQFAIELRVGQEIPAHYPVEVRDVSQNPPTVLRSFICQTFP